jgi:hypothetical protein
VNQSEYAKIFADVKLTDDDFTPRTFLPGSSGSTQLFNTLMEQTGIGEAVKLR